MSSRKKHMLSENIFSLNLIDSYNIEDAYINKEELKLLCKKISQLNKQTQEIFRLKLVGDLNFKEIS